VQRSLRRIAQEVESGPIVSHVHVGEVPICLVTPDILSQSMRLGQTERPKQRTVSAWMTLFQAATSVSAKRRKLHHNAFQYTKLRDLKTFAQEFCSRHGFDVLVPERQNEPWVIRVAAAARSSGTCIPPCIEPPCHTPDGVWGLYGRCIATHTEFVLAQNEPFLMVQSVWHAGAPRHCLHTNRRTTQQMAQFAGLAPCAHARSPA
jgi:hypothetical protein